MLRRPPAAPDRSLVGNACCVVLAGRSRQRTSLSNLEGLSAVAPQEGWRWPFACRVRGWVGGPASGAAARGRGRTGARLQVQGHKVETSGLELHDQKLKIELSDRQSVAAHSGALSNLGFRTDLSGQPTSMHGLLNKTCPNRDTPEPRHAPTRTRRGKVVRDKPRARQIAAAGVRLDHDELAARSAPAEDCINHRKS